MTAMKHGPAYERALKFLTDYQKAYAAVNGLKYEIPGDVIEKEFREMFKDEEFVKKVTAKENISTFEEFKAKFITPYASEADQMRRIANEIIVAANLQESVLVDIPAGTLATLDFNACAIKTKDNDRAIVLNIGVNTFLHAVSNSFVGSVVSPMVNLPSFVSITDAIATSAQYAALSTLGWPKHGLTKTSGFKEPGLMNAVSSLTDSTSAFIIGHEFGHFLCGHLDDSNVKVSNLASKGNIDSLEFYQQSIDQEFEADETGFDLCIKWHKHTHTGQYQGAYLAIIFAFRLMELTEAFAPGGNGISSHPPTPDRRKKFEKLYYAEFDAEVKNEIHFLDGFMDKVIAFAKFAESQSEGTDQRVSTPPS